MIFLSFKLLLILLILSFAKEGFVVSATKHLSAELAWVQCWPGQRSVECEKLFKDHVSHNVVMISLPYRMHHHDAILYLLCISERVLYLVIDDVTITPHVADT